MQDVIRSVDFRRADGNDDEMVDIMPLVGSHEDRDDCPATSRDGKYSKVRHGISIDSGSAAFVMPESGLPGSPKQPSEGSTIGQKFIGATGEITENA